MAQAYPLPLRRMGRHCSQTCVSRDLAIVTALSDQTRRTPGTPGVFLCQGSGIAGPVSVGSFGISGISGTGT